MAKKKGPDTIAGVIASFIDASKLYKKDVTRFAIHVSGKLRDSMYNITHEDIVRAIAGIPNPHISYQDALNTAIKAIHSLPDTENVKVAEAKLEKNKPVVHNRMKHAYEAALEIIEPIAVRCCISDYVLSKEFDSLSAEAANNICCFAWNKAKRTVCRDNVPAVSDWEKIMSLFETYIDIMDISVSEAVRDTLKESE